MAVFEIFASEVKDEVCRLWETIFLGKRETGKMGRRPFSDGEGVQAGF